MYTACTFQLSKVFQVPFLELVPRVFFYLALAAWIVTFAGLLYELFGTLVLRSTLKHLPSRMNGLVS
jgi:hypothetical protein